MQNKIDHNLVDAVIAVTYQCNSKCRMCNIWQDQRRPEMTIEDYKKLPITLKDINISGGEPFLNLELPKIIAIISERCPEAKIIISTNAFATGLIKRQLIEILKIRPDIGIAVSLDGVGDKHEEVRRIADGWQKVMVTIQMIKEELGITNVRIAFTAGDYNIEHLSKAYDLAKRLDVDFTMAAVHNSENFFQVQGNTITAMENFRREFNYVMRQQLKSWHPKQWLRAFFTYGLLTFVLTKERILPNYTGKMSFFLDPLGNVFPSDASMKIMGNIKDFKDVDELMNSERAQTVLESEKECEKSWMICTVRASMKRHPIRIASWVARQKLFSIFS